VGVLLIRATMRVTSHTLPIWLMWRAWKLLVPLLVITVLSLWWWTWRVEGLLILHLLLIVVGVLMSLLDRLVLIRQWYCSLQGVNLISDPSNGVFDLLKSSVGGLLVLHE
jgi:hypothetical protein